MVGDKWAHRLAVEGVIPAEDEALYSYGLRQSGVFLLNVVTILVIGGCLGMLGESVIFMVTYFPIRRMAGGYHAPSQGKCYLWGIVLTLAVLLTVRGASGQMMASVILLAVGSGAIWLLSPVEDHNKPLDERERAHFRRRAQQFLVVAMVVYGCLVAWGAKVAAMTLSASLAALGVMLILGWCKNRARNKK